VLVFWMGIYPMSFIDIFSATVANLIADHEQAMAASGGGSMWAVLWTAQ
jgi:NADH:ubiquinone oxidoreductase subunit 4 (subunit M)